MRFQRPQLEIVDFCARECVLQRSGELSVSRMVQAWSWAIDRFGPMPRPRPIDVPFVMQLGRILEPEKVGGWRKTPVTAVDGVTVIGAHPRDIARQVELLLEAQRRLEPAEVYRLFEEIHPFVDGNGRCGQILFNYLGGTLKKPVMAPDFWGDARRLEVHRAL